MMFTLITFALIYLMHDLSARDAPAVFPIAALIVYLAYLIHLAVALGFIEGWPQ